MINDRCANTRDIGPREAIGLSQHRWPLGTLKIEHRFASSPDDVNMRRPMITGIDHESQPGESQDGWHRLATINPNDWVSKERGSATVPYFNRPALGTSLMPALASRPGIILERFIPFRCRVSAGVRSTS